MDKIDLDAVVHQLKEALKETNLHKTAPETLTMINKIDRSLVRIDTTLKDFKLQNGIDHAEIISHQKETNGRVTKNTGFRNKVTGALVLVSFIGMANIVMMITFWIKVI